MTSDKLLDLVYAASVDRTKWPDVLRALHDATGCAAAVLYDRSTGGEQRIGLNASLGCPDRAHADFQAHMRHKDVRVRRTRPAP